MNAFAAEVARRSGQDLAGCYQCGKCTAGCPTVKWFEWPNHGVIRKIQLGAEGELLASHAIHMCVACETCGTRCPNGIHMAPIMGALRDMAREKGVVAAEPAVAAFHGAFTNSAARYGRIHEITMLIAYKLKTRDFFTDVGAGIKLFLKGKLPIFPGKVKGKRELDRFFAQSGGQTGEGK
jgi:heterodisulfide reductase subunit C